jgi:transcription initiation factor TFIIIB Brf1 subunit/transcription initiation factor TFIIB
MGKTPSGVACAIVYVVLTREGFNISKHDVCKAADVSIPTMNKIENILKAEMA